MDLRYFLSDFNQTNTFLTHFLKTFFNFPHRNKNIPQNTKTTTENIISRPHSESHLLCVLFCWLTACSCSSFQQASSSEESRPNVLWQISPVPPVSVVFWPGHFSKGHPHIFSWIHVRALCGPITFWGWFLTERDMCLDSFYWKMKRRRLGLSLTADCFSFKTSTSFTLFMILEQISSSSGIEASPQHRVWVSLATLFCVSRRDVSITKPLSPGLPRILKPALLC